MQKILIIDDDERLAGLYSMTLSGQGYEVGAASNGKAGLDKIAEMKPDLVLLDAMMPILPGLETLATLRKTPGIENTKVIIMTALSDEGTHEKAISLGISDYIVKSQLTVAEVTEKINNLLASIR